MINRNIMQWQKPTTFPRGPIYPSSEAWNPTPSSQPPWYDWYGDPTKVFGGMSVVWNAEKKGWDTSQPSVQGGGKGFISWDQAPEEWRKWVTQQEPTPTPTPTPTPMPTPTPTSQPPWYQKPGFGTMTYVWNPEKKGWDTSQIVGPGGNEPPYSKGFIPWYQASQEWRKWITEMYPDYEPPPFPRGPVYPGSPEWNPKPAAGNGLSEIKPFSATLGTPLPTPPSPLPPSPLPPQPPQPNIPTPKPEYPTPGRPRKPFDNIFAWRKKGPLWW